MNNTSYYLRKAKISKIEEVLEKQYNLKTCFRKKRERVMKNGDIIVACRDKYVAVFLMDESKKNKYEDISTVFM